MNDTTEINLRNVAEMAAEQFKMENAEKTEEMVEDCNGNPIDRSYNQTMVEDDDEFVMIDTPLPKAEEDPVVVEEETPKDALVMETPKRKPIGIADPSVTASVKMVPEAPKSRVSSANQEEMSEAERLFRDAMADMPTDEVNRLVGELLEEVTTETQNLMAQFAIPEDTAREGAIHKGVDRATAANKKWLRDNPQLGVIEIKKTDEDFIQLTDDEHKKLEKVKTVRLVLVEDEELKHITIENVRPEHKVDYIRTMDNTLSKFTVPLPTLGDNVTFKGAQILQLVQAVSTKRSTEDGEEENVPIEENIRNKASLVYEKLLSGAFLKKYDEKGRNTLTYAQFANIMPYQDLDLAVYAILVASSMEETKSSMICDKCGDRDHPFDFTYNVKSLLDLNDISDFYKERFDKVLAASGNPELAKEYHDEFAKADRYRSPYTNNVYELGYPTVARAINIFQRVDQSDQAMMYNTAAALFMNAMMIPTKEGTYVRVAEDELPILLETMQTLPDEDVSMINNLIAEHYIYIPKFVLKTTCPRCGKNHEIEVNVEDLVFLKAQNI